MSNVTRRTFMAAVGAVGLLPACPRAGPCYRFFDRAEAQFVEAACDRLIPADDSGPGALAAGAVAYLDQQLAGPWGAGTQPYRAGSWQPGSPLATSGTPTALFRCTIQAVERRLQQQCGLSFSRLTTPAQDALLRAWQDGSADAPGIRAAAFFAVLLTMTVEGYFSNPSLSARRDRIAWRVRAFAGAHAGAISA